MQVSAFSMYIPHTYWIQMDIRTLLVMEPEYYGIARSKECLMASSNHQEPQYQIQYIPRNMHTVFALLCFVEVIHWLIFPYPSGLLHWHCGNLTIAPVPAKQPWWIWINTSCEFIMNDCITTTKQSTTKPCAYFLGYTVCRIKWMLVFYMEGFHLSVPSCFWTMSANQMQIIFPCFLKYL